MQISRLDRSRLMFSTTEGASTGSLIIQVAGETLWFDLVADEAHRLGEEMTAWAQGLRERSASDLVHERNALEAVCTFLASGFLAEGVQPTSVGQMVVGVYRDVLGGSTQLEALSRALSPTRTETRIQEIADSEHSDHQTPEGEI